MEEQSRRFLPLCCIRPSISIHLNCPDMNKLLHTRIRVSDLERSMEFYCNGFGLMVYKRNDPSKEGDQIVHLRLPGNEHMLELRYAEDYEVKVPKDLVSFTMGVPDIRIFCERVEKNGILFAPSGWRELLESPEKRGLTATDPDGYVVEVLEKK
jgi:lactoylglutathione lyase